MGIMSVRCPIIGTNVIRVTDLEGATAKIICGEYDEPTGICRLKKGVGRGGMLSELLERVSEETLDTRSVRCGLCAEPGGGRRLSGNLVGESAARSSRSRRGRP